MKKQILLLLCLFLNFLSFAETKTFYVTRHGQRGDPKFQKKFKFCDEDALMPDGEEQAKRLGKYLLEKGFNGTIFVSPYYRTLQTATFAHEAFPELPMILEPRIQEMASVKDNSGIVRRTKKCITKKEIKQNFPNVKIPRKIKFPWRVENEKQSQMDERIGNAIDEILESTSGDVFLVCHGGMMTGVIREMQKRGADFPRRKVYNCCLYTFTFDTETKKVINATDETLNYLPDRLVTDNLTYIPVSSIK